MRRDGAEHRQIMPVADLSAERAKRTCEALGAYEPCYTHYCAPTPGLSTSPPIRKYGFLGSQGRNCFEVGFPLRCLQRLSRPHIATLHCDWRHNRSTGGYVHPGPLVTSDKSSQVPTITADRNQIVVRSFEPSSLSLLFLQIQRCTQTERPGCSIKYY